MVIQPNYDSPDEYDAETDPLRNMNDGDQDGANRYGFESVITEGGDVSSWGPSGALNPDPNPGGFTVMPSDERTQNPTTLVPGAPISPPDISKMLFDDDNLVEMGASETCGFRSVFMDNSKAYILLPYNPYRKRAILSWNGTAADIMIGRETSIDNLTGQTAIANAYGKGTFYLPHLAGAGNVMWLEYTSKQALYGIMLQAPPLAYGISVMDESYEGAPNVG